MNFKLNNIEKRTLISRLKFTNKFYVLQVFSQKTTKFYTIFIINAFHTLQPLYYSNKNLLPLVVWLAVASRSTMPVTTSAASCQRLALKSRR